MNGQVPSNIVHTHEPAPNLNLGPSQSAPGPSNASPPDLLLLQVKAFLEAAEDVEVDPETIQELIQLISDRESTTVVEDLESEDEEWQPGDENNLHDLDISALFNNNAQDGISIHMSFWSPLTI